MIYICTTPHDHEFHGECKRYPDNPCCMCPGINVVIPLDEIKKMHDMLNSDGSNTKKAVNDILAKYLVVK